EESDADEAFVRDLAAKLGLEFSVHQYDVARAAAETGENLEATARRVRYDSLRYMSDALDDAWVATGHTADDQAETVLHRLVRGTGPQGLPGIPAVRRFPCPVLVRPLLAVPPGRGPQYPRGL